MFTFKSTVSLSFQPASLRRAALVAVPLSTSESVRCQIRGARPSIRILGRFQTGTPASPASVAPDSCSFMTPRPTPGNHIRGRLVRSKAEWMFVLPHLSCHESAECFYRENMKGSPSLFRKMSPLLWRNCNWPPCTSHSSQREDRGGCRVGRLLACGLVNTTTNRKTTKQNGTMTEAHQDQRTSKSLG